MELQTQKLAADLLVYLPVLKQKLTDLVGETNQMEQMLIDSAFENHELFLEYEQNNGTLSVESIKKMNESGESNHLQMASMALFYKKMTSNFKECNFMEADRKLLRKIFRLYRESMLNFKSQRDAYKAIKASLTEMVKA